MRACASRRSRGYSLLELTAVIVVVSAVMASTVALIVSARRRFKGAISASAGSHESASVTRKLRSDIRAARGAKASPGALTLSGPDGRQIVWRIRKGHLVRAAGKRERVFNFGASALRSVVTGNFVEAGVTLGSRNIAPRTIYVGAQLRVGARQ